MRLWLGLLSMLLYMQCAYGQYYQEVQQEMLALLHDKQQNFLSPADVYDFYAQRNFTPAWMNNAGNRAMIDSFIHDSRLLGLLPGDYLLPAFFENEDHKEAVLAELKTSDVVLQLCKHLATGAGTPLLSYNGLKYIPVYDSLAQKLSDALTQGRFDSFIVAISPRMVAYDRLRQSMAQLDSGQQVNIRDNINSFLLKPEEKKTALSAAMNTLRWLQQALQKNHLVIVANIPSATLLVFEDSKIILESRIIPGKSSSPTHTLCSKIDRVILYPYWTVPQSIAVKEMLPVIKRNRNYLLNNHFNVYNKNGRLVDPAGIQWKQLGPGNFPYTLRQSTGCDNSLGIVKFDFESPFGIYLHDTPGKALFNFSQRYFSHGCVRVEQAIPMARLLLKENTIAVDTLKQDLFMPGQEPQYLNVKEPVPLFIVYNTAWFDKEGVVRFYPDVYHLLQP